MIGTDIENLIKLCSKLPGLGPRSSRRMVLHLLKNKEKLLLPLMQSLQYAADHITECTTCGNMDTQNPCAICSEPTRQNHHICIVENVADLWALDRSGAFKGTYHVLHGTLSALDGVGPDELRIPQLKHRIEFENIREITLALNATLEGQTTNHYLAEELSSPTVKITSIAQGVPLGGELDYLDTGTLITALTARRTLESES